ncbi:MAG: M1 family metallopeptidase [Acidimicrobiales bacterium]|jgi:puromycin-sensitive aminopeptidase
MPSHRLSRTVLPQHYALHLVPDLENHTFTGSVRIEATADQALKELTLNAIELNVSSAQVNGQAVGFSLDTDLEQLTLSGLVAAGPLTIDLEFSGILNDRLRGFYRSTLNIEGQDHTVATTQFQSTDARRCFPCFDEPDFKATFGITLDAPSGLLAISNGAEVSRTSLTPQVDRVVFADTIALSTYLVAFVVGPLAATDPIDVGGIPVRVIHPPGKGHLTQFALEVAAHSLRWFAEWYDLPVPGGKVDLVALPDFAFGAMENLGCITFREVLLLVDPEQATQQELEAVAAVLSHELAHLWFGDLVTMRWWNGIWLNEAFATFMEMKAVETFRPQWDIWTGFGTSRAAALDVDSLAATRPIEYPVETPADAEGMFDLLTYEKGAAVVRMLEQFLGQEVFRNGVRRYLANHLYGNTDNEDLWQALEEVSGQPVGDLMQDWIFQGGHPEVTGEVTGETLTLRQQPFRYNPGGADQHWSIPVRLRTTEGTQAVLLAGDQPVTVQLDAPLCNLNADASGFYRSSLPEAQATTAAERANLIGDRWAQTLAGRQDPHQFVAAMEPYALDGDLAVWQAILGGLTTLDLFSPGRPVAGVVDLLLPLAETLSWSGPLHEDQRTQQLRGLLLGALGQLGHHQPTIDRCRELWSSGAVDPAVTAAAVSVTARFGDAATFGLFRQRADQATTAQEEQRFLRALALFPGQQELLVLLEEIVAGGIRSQDAPFILRQALMHPEHRNLVWATVTEHWGTLSSQLPSNSIARLLEGVRALIDPNLHPDVDQFLDQHPVPQGALVVDQHRERRRVNVRLAQRLASK